MTIEEKVHYVLEKLEVDTIWFFRQAYLYTETPEERWFLNWKVKDFIEKGIVPEPVELLADRIMEDCQALFWRK